MIVMLQEIKFLESLFKKTSARTDILDFLVEDKLITIAFKQEFLNEHSSMHPTRLASLLKEFKDSEKLILVSYEWRLLPEEFMSLILVSPTAKREFTYTT